MFQNIYAALPVEQRIFSYFKEGVRRVVDNVLDWDIIESSISTHAITVTFTLGKSINSIISTSYMFSNTTVVLLQNWLWHWINDEDWYAETNFIIFV